jgi:hypothetical protein
MSVNNFVIAINMAKITNHAESFEILSWMKGNAPGLCPSGGHAMARSI